MEMVLQFVSGGPSGILNGIGKIKRNSPSNMIYDWEMVQQWAKKINAEIIALMNKNEPDTKIKISFIATNISEGKSKPSFLSKLLHLNSSSEQKYCVARIVCKVKFKQPNKEWQEALFLT